VDYVDTEPEALLPGEFDITYTNGPDLGTRISQAFRIQGVPETYIIDQETYAFVQIGPFTLWSKSKGQSIHVRIVICESKAYRHHLLSHYQGLLTAHCSLPLFTDLWIGSISSSSVTRPGHLVHQPPFPGT